MYDPQVNDYVRWTTALGMVHEGWVYFKGTPDNNESRVKNKWVATSNYSLQHGIIPSWEGFEYEVGHGLF